MRGMTRSRLHPIKPKTYVAAQPRSSQMADNFYRPQHGRLVAVAADESSKSVAEHLLKYLSIRTGHADSVPKAGYTGAGYVPKAVRMKKSRKRLLLSKAQS